MLDFYYKPQININYLILLFLYSVHYLRGVMLLKVITRGYGTNKSQYANEVVFDCSSDFKG